MMEHALARSKNLLGNPSEPPKQLDRGWVEGFSTRDTTSVTKRDKIRPLSWPSTTPAYNEQVRFIFHKYHEMSILGSYEGPQKGSFLWVRAP
jgi:hypothetical protein